MSDEEKRQVIADLGKENSARFGKEVSVGVEPAQEGVERRSLESMGAEVVAERTFRDHHRYRARDLRGLKELAPIWVTSEKDAVKIIPSWLRGLDLRVLESQLEVPEEDALVDRIEEHLGLR